MSRACPSVAGDRENGVGRREEVSLEGGEACGTTDKACGCSEIYLQTLGRSKAISFVRFPAYKKANRIGPSCQILGAIQGFDRACLKYPGFVGARPS